MYNVFDTEIFGVILTILFFNIGIYIQKKTNKPIFNPLLIATLGIILFLSITKIPYESYKLGGDRINFFFPYCNPPLAYCEMIENYAHNFLKKRVYVMLFLRNIQHPFDLPLFFLS